MTPSLSVLQLDTRFPRVPGDVCCIDTYATNVEILRVPAASVGNVVTRHPESVDIGRFEQAVLAARGDMIATSCGFLAHWQDQLQALTAMPVVTSALIALRDLHAAPDNTMILTFDAPKLIAGHKIALGAFRNRVVGLDPMSHLRQVIEADAEALDEGRVAEEITVLLARHLTPEINTLILECTNLPPYKAAIRGVFDGRIIDILTEIETRRSGTVRPEFL